MPMARLLRRLQPCPIALRAEAARMTLGIAILGTGKIAGHVAAAVTHSRLAQVRAVGSRDLERARKFAVGFDIPVAYGGYAEAVADPSVDAVYIALPHTLHAEWSIAAAAEGKHILCEKPLGVDAGEVRRVIDAASRAGVALVEAFAYRFYPTTARFLELLRSGVIGEPRVIDATFGYRADGATNYLFRRELAGGSVLDVGCYTMSMARLVAGLRIGMPFDDPTVVAGALYEGAGGVDHAAAASLAFGSGVVGRIACSINAGLPDRVSVYGSEGIVNLESPWLPGRLGEVAVEVIRPTGRTREVLACPDDLYAVEVDAFASTVAAGEHPAMSHIDSLGNARALDRWLAAERVAAVDGVG